MHENGLGGRRPRDDEEKEVVFLPSLGSINYASHG
jgi:hypothetical protein